MAAWTDRPAPDAEERAIRRTLWLLACGVGAVIVGLVTLVAANQVVDRRDGDGGTGAQAPVAVDAGIGPLSGADIAAHTAAARARLDRIAGGTAGGTAAAVVSFDRYLPEADARRLVAPLPVVALLAAAPDDGPDLVTGSVSGWVGDRREALEDERRELTRLLPTTGDAGFEAEFRAEIDRLGRVLDGIRPSGPLVFGVLVTGDASALRSLAAKAGVRLVDVGLGSGGAVGNGPGADLDPALWRGLRPEETGRAGEPPVRPPDDPG